MRKIYGIDEAALGPILGPYTACAVNLESEGPLPLVEKLKKIWFDTAFDNGICLIGDSKKLYTPGKGLEELETSVMTFLYTHHNRIPQTFEEYLNMTGTQIPKDIPWYQSPLPLPREASEPVIREKAALLEDYMEENQVRFTGARLLFAPAQEFNRLLQQRGNKARVTQILLSSLFPQENQEDMEIIVDKQGGRQFYGDWLLELYPGQRIRAFQEGKIKSHYQVGERSLSFEQKADDTHFAPALASLFAKYARELAMIQFNSYWQKQHPELKETAGYPQDGKRFIADLKKIRDITPFKNTLIRAK